MGFEDRGALPADGFEERRGCLDRRGRVANLLKPPTSCGGWSTSTGKRGESEASFLRQMNVVLPTLVSTNPP